MDDAADRRCLQRFPTARDKARIHASFSVNLAKESEYGTKLHVVQQGRLMHAWMILQESHVVLQWIWWSCNEYDEFTRTYDEVTCGPHGTPDIHASSTEHLSSLHEYDEFTTAEDRGETL
jgi:hypothetical protein